MHLFIYLILTIIYHTSLSSLAYTITMVWYPALVGDHHLVVAFLVVAYMQLLRQSPLADGRHEAVSFLVVVYGRHVVVFHPCVVVCVWLQFQSLVVGSHYVVV
ncbi:hypothetical protein R6Q59_015142 [Mikania micrantha]